MSFVRNETQVALRDVHVALLESVDHYRDAAEFSSSQVAAECFNAIAEAREALANEYAEAIRAADDLPSVPDPELEGGEQFLSHLATLFAADELEGLVEQRLDAENRLEQLLQQSKIEAPLREVRADLWQSCRDNIARARQQLIELHPA
ncbi:hypothetical protein [Gilvimarinus chinensis]|uniref:hypothetical protein n=1 Tax=Gilvimarinus chinensis TaxID=396005 RepID=UPI000367F3E2|nr:hypothetical protein [Gilvimarinus chinensis]